MIGGGGEKMVFVGEIVIVENIRLVRLLALTADFGVKTTNAKLTPIFKLPERSKIQSFKTVILTQI